MTPETRILNPKKELMIAGETVTVRELAWMDALDFLKQLGGYLGKFISPKGEIEISASSITDIIANTDELSTALVTKTTGRDADFLRTVSLGQMLDLIDAALELNLSEEILAKGKKIAGRFQGFAGVPSPRTAMPAPPSATPTTSSSGRDTAEPS